MRPVAATAVITAVAFGAATPATAFETNGRHWDEMPVRYWINPAECPVLEDGSTIVEIMDRATQSWEDVACAEIRFEYMGVTDKGWDNDDQNTVYCVSNPEDWQFGVGAAGATLWLPKPEGYTVEVDLALNAADLEWVDGGGDALTQGVMDPQAMITHELGHWLGLAHTPDPFGTMYYGLLPNGIQATLAGDDKAGVCTLYPGGTTECAADEDCGEDRRCTVIEGIPVCDDLHDPAGAPCDKAHIDCEGMCWVSLYECSQMCWFTDQIMATAGYCAPVCRPDEGLDCPEGFECTAEPELDGHICLKEFIPWWPIGDDPPVEEVVEQGEEVGGVEVVGDAPAGDSPAPAPDTGVPADTAAGLDTGGGGGGSGCGTGDRAAAPGLLLLLALALVQRSRARSSPGG